MEYLYVEAAKEGMTTANWVAIGISVLAFIGNLILAWFAKDHDRKLAKVKRDLSKELSEHGTIHSSYHKKKEDALLEIFGHMTNLTMKGVTGKLSAKEQSIEKEKLMMLVGNASIFIDSTVLEKMTINAMLLIAAWLSSSEKFLKVLLADIKLDTEGKKWPVIQEELLKIIMDTLVDLKAAIREDLYPGMRPSPD